jgi:TIR domain
MREAEHRREEGDTVPMTASDADAAKFYVKAGHGGILYRRLTRALLFRAEFVQYPGGQHLHLEVQTSYVWAAAELGGWALILLSIHGVFDMHGVSRIVLLILGVPVVLSLSLRRAIVSFGIFGKTALGFVVVGLGAGLALFAFLFAAIFLTLFSLPISYLTTTIAGMGLIGFSWVIFRKKVPGVGAYVVDQLQISPTTSNVSQAYAGMVTVAPSFVLSAFISHGSPDEPFADKISTALMQNGVPTFLFRRNAVPGEKLHRTMRKGIAEHDRVILICSRASLNREPVLFEIEEALTREAKMKGESLLIPIRLDRYVLDEWKTEREDIAEAVRSRVVADFEGADQDEDKFQAGLRRLLTALRK